MDDAVHPDEYRQRFAAAGGVTHPNLEGVLEVLEIGGRPAVLLECLVGLSGAEFQRGLAAAPGAWYRLACQAALSAVGDCPQRGPDSQPGRLGCVLS